MKEMINSLVDLGILSREGDGLYQEVGLGLMGAWDKGVINKVEYNELPTSLVIDGIECERRCQINGVPVTYGYYHIIESKVTYAQNRFADDKYHRTERHKHALVAKIEKRTKQNII